MKQTCADMSRDAHQRVRPSPVACHYERLRPLVDEGGALVAHSVTVPSAIAVFEALRTSHIDAFSRLWIHVSIPELELGRDLVENARCVRAGRAPCDADFAWPPADGLHPPCRRERCAHERDRTFDEEEKKREQNEHERGDEDKDDDGFEGPNRVIPRLVAELAPARQAHPVARYLPLPAVRIS